MGIVSDIRKMSKDYLKDPQGQFFRQLDLTLKMHKQSGVPVHKVIQHLQDWISQYENLGK